MDYCKDHLTLFDKVNEMHGDIKVLVSEFKNMNGSMRDTKQNFEIHKTESKDYRRKIDVIWSTLHTMKWAIVLLFGSGVIWKLLEIATK